MAGALLLSGAACEDGDFPNFIIPVVARPVLVATTITVRSGDKQVGEINKPLAQPIVVNVSDQNGGPVANAAVNWTVLSGGGSVSAPNTVTDANGNTSVTWTMGPTPGVDSLKAMIANGAFVIITATARQPAPPVQQPQIVSATGDITPAVNQFRALLGTLNPNVAGEQPGGRREINWDGVPATFTNNDNFPGNFFNTTSPRGVLLTTLGSAFRISDNGYVDVNAAYAGEFNVFSSPKLFTARGSTVIDVRFFVAGSNTPALVTGFGSVFADVGLPTSTTIEYFDAAGVRLAIVTALPRSDAVGLSFIGAVFQSRVVARVRITSGNTPIDPNVTDNVSTGGTRDIVVMDDFIYGEPRITP
ncbi:MAG TPA: Ig-like domain-containing protein [Gemmatimonadaceae bacterium]